MKHFDYDGSGVLEMTEAVQFLEGKYGLGTGKDN